MMHFSSSNFTYVCCLLPFTARLYTTARQWSWSAKRFLEMTTFYPVLHYCLNLPMPIHACTTLQEEEEVDDVGKKYRKKKGDGDIGENSEVHVVRGRDEDVEKTGAGMVQGKHYPPNPIHVG